MILARIPPGFPFSRVIHQAGPVLCVRVSGCEGIVFELYDLHQLMMMKGVLWQRWLAYLGSEVLAMFQSTFVPSSDMLTTFLQVQDQCTMLGPEGFSASKSFVLLLQGAINNWLMCSLCEGNTCQT